MEESLFPMTHGRRWCWVTCQQLQIRMSDMSWKPMKRFWWPLEWTVSWKRRPKQNLRSNRQKEGRSLSRRGLQQFTGQDNVGRLQCYNQSSLSLGPGRASVELSLIARAPGTGPDIGKLSICALKEPYPSFLQVKCLDKSAIWVHMLLSENNGKQGYS